jgi:formylglycine-generating enzyme required for sulfatase activity
VGAININNTYSQIFGNNLRVTYKISASYNSGLISELIFENKSIDTLSISNVVPYGQDSNSVYITGRPPWDVACAWLFRPGYNPVSVILPDNAWELGYSSFKAGGNYSVCALARRTAVDGAQKKRYETILPPNSSVTYSIHTEVFNGPWQNGLRTIFRDRYLFDLENFDNSMFNRKDLSWIKESYIIILQMAWANDFYDRFTGRYTYPDMLKRYNDIFGKVDVFGIWPTWPRLGLDERNQWDLYRDLPGGTVQLKNYAKMSRMSGTRFFIAYNPWDNSTRKEDHYKGMSQIISETDADGVVLDTRGSSSYQLQAAADSVRKGIIMYSEGMAIPKDMPGIISGRVHNAIFMSPELNLNKLIKPDFSIFRVCDVGEDIIHREIAVSFFNGYGTELNLFRPGGRDENYTNDLRYLAKTTFILRQNNDAFLDKDWTPMIETLTDNVFVNRWTSGDKTIFTILNMNPEGINGKLFEIDSTEGKHFVSLWNHENIKPIKEREKFILSANASGWQYSLSGTRKEGSLDCIAVLPDLIRSKMISDSIVISGKGLSDILIWKGEPSVQTVFREFHLDGDTTIRVKDIFGIYEGKIVLQLIENERLKDENILFLKGGKPWLISRINRTIKSSTLPSDMLLIPGTTLSLNLSTDEDFFPYPDDNGIRVKIDSFLIDRYPVTNEQYFEFVTKSGYRPTDTTRYLRQWMSGKFIAGQEKYPVTYVSYEDMLAYAKWAKKRLPTEAEWQLSAQGPGKRKWPWGDEFHSEYCNNSSNKSSPVDAFPNGQSQYGVVDLVGNVWQMTNDMYFNGTNYFSVIRGGSYYKPESSWWYIKGGPQSLDRTQILLLVSPGFDRSPTVGFRCVKDVDSKNFKNKR